MGAIDLVRGRSWWQGRSPRERVVAGTFGTALLLALAWFAVLSPLRADGDRMRKDLSALRTTRAVAEQRANEIAGLARAPASPQVGDVRAQFDAVAARLQLKAVPVSIERVEGDGLRATFDSIGFESLAAFVDALQREAKLRVSDLDATARVEPGQVRAELTLRR